MSIRFPEKGMVFLLGKSGSGKSTLLNLLGGLDRYNGGEIIIKGVSSKSFRQKHFDSYRNTYVGFIFQEYNILDEFSVGANIALAIQLQGRKATNDAINAILEEVDLAGYGNRKPNELSGGQKQRVAIARALVKNPQIIMADEPTGALDSATGRQVLDTLKKLSADKLVIVVSHDREFAEKYADRIVELADGRIISDTEYFDESSPEAEEREEIHTLVYSGNTVTIPERYHLTLEDVTAINAYIDRLEKGEITLSLSSKQDTKASGRKAVPADESRIPVQEKGNFKLIKSRLPMRYAFKMGGSGLKHKKVRLVFTILLSCVAFGLFGLADTFGAYDYVTTCTNSIMDSGITYASLTKSVKTYYNSYNSTDEDFYYTTYGHYISDEDLATIKQETGLDLSGVYSNEFDGQNIYINQYFGDVNEKDNIYDEFSMGNLYSGYLRGYAEVDSTTLEHSNMTLVAGRLPEGDKDEIVISSYLLESFKSNGYRDQDAIEKLEQSQWENGDPKDESVYDTVMIKSAQDILGKTLLGHTIVGVVDTGVDLDRYEGIYSYSESDSTADMLLKYALQNEFESLRNYSLACVAMVGDGFIDRMMKEQAEIAYFDGWAYISDDSLGTQYEVSSVAPLSGLDRDKIVWLDGEKDSFNDTDLLLPLSLGRDLFYMMAGSEMYDPEGNLSEEELIIAFLQKTGSFSLTYDSYSQKGYSTMTDDGFQLVGLYNDMDFYNTIFISDKVFEKYENTRDGIYFFAVAAMPKTAGEISRIVAYGDTTEADVRFEMQNPVIYELSILRDMFDVLSPIFLYIGLGFALFASLMMSNFISTSISYKKREIGILRAIGSRGNDVFRIFFSESFIIAMINFVLTTTGLFTVTYLINTILRNETGLLITVLNCGPRQIILEFAVSLLVAAVASFLPVKRIASKKPIDAIRDR